MYKEDIKLLVKRGYWISCFPVKKKWEMVIYERKSAGWVKRKRKLFTYPAAAYNWAINYLEPLVDP